MVTINMNNSATAVTPIDAFESSPGVVTFENIYRGSVIGGWIFAFPNTAQVSDVIVKDSFGETVPSFFMTTPGPENTILNINFGLVTSTTAANWTLEIAYTGTLGFLSCQVTPMPYMPTLNVDITNFALPSNMFGFWPTFVSGLCSGLKITFQNTLPVVSGVDTFVDGVKVPSTYTFQAGVLDVLFDSPLAGMQLRINVTRPWTGGNVRQIEVTPTV